MFIVFLAKIHLTQISSQQLKSSTPTIATTSARTSKFPTFQRPKKRHVYVNSIVVNVPASIVAQRSNSSGPPQAISITKVFNTSENQGQSTNVFIHAPLQTQAPRHPSPSK